MKLNKFNKHFLSGLFLIIGFLVTTLSLFYSEQGLYEFFDKKMYLHTYLDQASGLNRGSLVTLNGIKVGNIKQLEISPNDVRKIHLIIEIDSRLNQKIPKDSEIEVKTQGALGDRYLQITPGQLNEFLSDNETIVAKKNADLLDFLSDKGKEAEKLFLLLDEGIKLMRTLNEQGRIVETLKNLNQASIDLKSLIIDARKLIQNIDATERVSVIKTLNNFQQISEKITRGEGTIGALIQDPTV